MANANQVAPQPASQQQREATPPPATNPETSQLAQQRASLHQQLSELQAQVLETSRDLDALHAEQDEVRRDLSVTAAQRAEAKAHADTPKNDPSKLDQHPRATASKSPPPARTETDAAAGVLDRLRHQAPAMAPAPASLQAPAAEPRRYLDAAVRERLEHARDALSAGRIDDARRSLQVAQLRLVFRPIGPDGDTPPPPSGESAAAVARALSLLGVGDTNRALGAIDQAIAASASESADARFGDSGNPIR
jgi:hypothetical protein